MTFDDAAYATVGAIALHGVRQAEAALGERIGVIGLGLVGQLAVRILARGGLRASSASTSTLAPSQLARGAAEPRVPARRLPTLEAAVGEATAGLGLDAVLICAATAPRTRSSSRRDSPATADGRRRRRRADRRAARAAVRKGARAAALALVRPRPLRPRVRGARARSTRPATCAGPSSATCRRSSTSSAQGRVDPSALTTHRFPVERGGRGLRPAHPRARRRPAPFGVLLDYPADAAPRPTAAGAVTPPQPRPACGSVGVGLIGAGAFARATLLPALRRRGRRARRRHARGTGLHGGRRRRALRLRATADDAQEILDDPAVDAVVIATRHASHAALAAAALRAGKPVFVEKPLALDASRARRGRAGARWHGDRRPDGRLQPAVRAAHRAAARCARRRRRAVSSPSASTPARCPPTHWLHDPRRRRRPAARRGLPLRRPDRASGARPDRLGPRVRRPGLRRALEASDSVVAVLRFDSGSVGSLIYTGAGDPRLPEGADRGPRRRRLGGHRRLSPSRGFRRWKANGDQTRTGQGPRTSDRSLGRRRVGARAPAPGDELPRQHTGHAGAR